jgi:hypothetical protein
MKACHMNEMYGHFTTQTVVAAPVYAAAFWTAVCYMFATVSCCQHHSHGLLLYIEQCPNKTLPLKV